VTTLNYDQLNRLLGKTYSDGTPAATFVYDESSVTIGSSGNTHSGPYATKFGIGKLTTQYTGKSAQGVGLAVKQFTYDAMGRVTGTAECWGAAECASIYGTRATALTYDAVGNRTSLLNSTALKFSYGYHDTGRLQTASHYFANANITTPMVSGMTYFPSGQPQQMTTTTAAATLGSAWTLDSRLRVTSYQATTTANSSNPTSYSYALTYTPNGNINHTAETVYVPSSGPSTRSWNYAYDTLNRMTNNPSSGISNLYPCLETYDPFGNRVSQAVNGTGVTCTTPSNPVTAGTNRLSDPTVNYDASGNQRASYNGGSTDALTWDAEGRLSSSTPAGGATTTCTYGADGQRAVKSVGGIDTEYVRDPDGSLLATYVQGGYNNQNQELWVGGKHFGTVSLASGGATSETQNFSLTNWLGSEMARTDPGTGIPTAGYISQPFGDAQSTLFGTDTDPLHFTGKERDSESGNDYFDARYYSSSMGRFMSPDWSAKEEPVPYATMDDPQSLNLYSYVKNNPLSHVDKDGHCLEDACILEAGAGVTILALASEIYLSQPENQRNAAAALSSATSSVGSSNSSGSNGAAPATTPLPTGIVGTDPTPTDGSRTKSGPLAPEHGGTGDAGKDFGTLTGGAGAPAAPEKRYPAGTLTGDNGIALRPAKGKSGPKIDIPANGSKPHEALHYPPPPPPTQTKP
jgi:RHS repeat-associated protein